MPGRIALSVVPARLIYIGGVYVADAKRQRPPSKIERTIGSTTYIVTSHFQDQGSTAVDKIRCLLGTNTKADIICQKS